MMRDTLDEEMDYIADLVRKSEAGTSITNPRQVLRVRDAYNLLKKSVKGENVEIVCELNKPYVSMGAVTILGKEILIEDPVAFARAGALASNFEVYPKVDGTVQMNFTFHGLTRKVVG